MDIGKTQMSWNKGKLTEKHREKRLRKVKENELRNQLHYLKIKPLEEF